MLVSMDRRSLEIAKKNHREAIARQQRDDGLDAFNRAMEAEFGPVDPERVEAIRGAWFR